MRYDDDAYREVFPKQEIPKPIIKVETPVETFMPSVEEENTSVNRSEEPNETVVENSEEKGE